VCGVVCRRECVYEGREGREELGRGVILSRVEGRNQRMKLGLKAKM
jgi:hypothetical protein